MRPTLTQDQFIEKANSLHGDKYDYSKSVYKRNNNKIIIICKEHGQFLQLANNHLQGQGCPKCRFENTRQILKFNNKEFIQKAQEIHGSKYNYSKVNYINAHKKIIITCPVHGDFDQKPGHHLEGYNCKRCRDEKYKLTTQEFIDKATVTHNNKYDYSKVNYTNSCSKVIIICKQHGNFYQQPGNHLQGQGCPLCAKEQFKQNHPTKPTTEEFINRANKIHNFIYSYKFSKYKDAKTKVVITCKKHGNFEQTPDNHLQGKGCSVCKSSKGELAIKAILDKHGIENKQEYKLPDEKYLFEYDFYLPEYNILIEYHGIQHYEYREFFHETYHDFERQQMRDKNKITLAKGKGIPLLEFNYKQFETLSREQFEEMVIKIIYK